MQYDYHGEPIQTVHEQIDVVFEQISHTILVLTSIIIYQLLYMLDLQYEHDG